MASKSPPTAILQISCPDKPGLVTGVAGFVTRHGGNILHSDQYSDVTTQHFFMRVEWPLEGFGLARERIVPTLERELSEFELNARIDFSDVRPKIAIFASKESHCLWDLLVRQAEGELPMEIACVVANHRDLEPVVQRFGHRFVHVPSKDRPKQELERDQLQLLNEVGATSIILARYMQILSQEFVVQFPLRIINIHHSFLPAFEGARPYHRAFERGVKLVGATSHFVTTDLDQGPIIDQDVIHVSHRDGVSDLIRKGRDLERMVLARAVRLYIERRVVPFGNKTVVF